MRVAAAALAIFRVRAAMAAAGVLVAPAARELLIQAAAAVLLLIIHLEHQVVLALSSSVTNISEVK